MQCNNTGVEWIIYQLRMNGWATHLKPNDDNAWRQQQQFTEILQIAVLWVRIIFEEFLQHLYLVVGETGAIGPLATGCRRIWWIWVGVETLLKHFIELKLFWGPHATAAAGAGTLCVILWTTTTANICDIIDWNAFDLLINNIVDITIGTTVWCWWTWQYFGATAFRFRLEIIIVHAVRVAAMHVGALVID